ncbi:hypothetical protein AJ79_04095 [Helicocarpus griseus UAMH5409]|uniref:RRM domain-containing protein n=1 Tax=Helicocarpus griseus UAMH5409 TaxID=1447875 RepID=A0A2B7XLV2_9EURO|nr:hypothetical protein AJ79_04095 [Helicocarpus griseus UAMH5409]
MADMQNIRDGLYFVYVSLISLRHAAFRAISAGPAAFAAKPRTLAALAPTFLKATAPGASLVNAAFQQRWNSEFSDEAPAFRSDNYAPKDRQDKRRVLEPSANIYVGNLFFEVTAEDLKRDLAKFGNVNSVRIIYDSRGLSRGFGYVEFDSQEAADAAINELNMTIYEGRRIVVNYAARTFNAPTTPRLQEPTKTLFIGNLSFEMTDHELNDLFKDIKNVKDVRVAVDRKTSKPRGFAHADFEDVESAKAGFEILSQKAPYGRTLKVDFSKNTKEYREERFQRQSQNAESPSQ